MSSHHDSYRMPPSYSNQHGGSITASPSSFMIRIEDKRDQDSNQNKKLTVISPAQQVVEQAKLTLQRQNRPVYKRRKPVKKIINRRQRTEQKQRRKSKIEKKKVKKTKAEGKKNRKRTYKDIFD